MEGADRRVPIHVKPTVDMIGLGAYYDPPNDPVEGKASPVASSSRSVLQKGTFICLYAGEYLSTQEANERWSSTPRQYMGEGNYILTLRLPGKRIHMDPRHEGNVGRFFNHSCDPTCVVHVVRWGGDSIWPRAAIVVSPSKSPGCCG
jgi:histone-lysine N-methyltransferase SETMAR